ncbi:hypothetical protein I180019D1_28120 [Alistipes sp. i18-0019-D1]|jgi:hypothetical protein
MALLVQEDLRLADTPPQAVVLTATLKAVAVPKELFQQLPADNIRKEQLRSTARAVSQMQGEGHAAGKARYA